MSLHDSLIKYFQGGLGDCWFLSALASLAQPLPEDNPLKIKEIAINHVLQTEHNTSEKAKLTGMYRFRFFRLGEFVDVVIDDNLPRKKRAKPSKSNEWWVPLCEKAYAKFSGSYTQIIGGNTCWALTELTGGIAVEMKVRRSSAYIIVLSSVLQDMTNETVTSWAADDVTKDGRTRNGFDLFELFFRIQTRALICTSNLGDGGNESVSKGLVHGHAYSLLSLDLVKVGKKGKTQKIVKIRNPWSKLEWDGRWADGAPEWDHVSDEEKTRIGYEDTDDGGFWMSWEDWLDEFEMFTICLLQAEEHDLGVNAVSEE